MPFWNNIFWYTCPRTCHSFFKIKDNVKNHLSLTAKLKLLLLHPKLVLRWWNEKSLNSLNLALLSSAALQPTHYEQKLSKNHKALNSAITFKIQNCIFLVFSTKIRIIDILNHFSLTFKKVLIIFEQNLKFLAIVIQWHKSWASLWASLSSVSSNLHRFKWAFAQLIFSEVE